MNFEYSNISYLFWILLIISSIVIYFGYKDIIHFKKLRLLLLVRVFSIAFLLFLIVDPRFNFSFSNIKKLPWNIYIDKSLSMAYHTKPSSVALSSGIDQIISTINEKKFKIKYTVLVLNLIQVGLQ